MVLRLLLSVIFSAWAWDELKQLPRNGKRNWITWKNLKFLIGAGKTASDEYAPLFRLWCIEKKNFQNRRSRKGTLSSIANRKRQIIEKYKRGKNKKCRNLLFPHFGWHSCCSKFFVFSSETHRSTRLICICVSQTLSFKFDAFQFVYWICLFALCIANVESFVKHCSRIFTHKYSFHETLPVLWNRF